MLTKLRLQVSAFMDKFQHPVVFRPTTPPLFRLKLRARLIAEEAVETVEAMCFPGCVSGPPSAANWKPEDIARLLRELRPGQDYTIFTAASALLMAGIDMAVARTFTLSEMAKVVDGMADLDYVVEGARLEWGIDGERVADIVHTANMTKHLAVDEHGKLTKPADFVPPDEAIERELLLQGFTGLS